MKRTTLITLIIISSAFLFSCREQYTPPVIKAGVSYLVVDGIINNNDTTVIKLSHTVNLNAAVGTLPETSAQVTVESDANTTYILKELKTKGTYASTAPLALNKAANYRLRIVTAGNKTYLSDFVPVKDSPPIDSISYSLPPDGLQISASTHDATNNTRYYRYDYVETWNFHAVYSSNYMVVGQNIVPRTPANQIFSCWTNAPSTDITLASTAKLTRDLLYLAPVTIVPATSEKLSVKYSILVKQYALTTDAFNFWQLVKKNTEQLGSIFDAQPSQVKGNIHNINDGSEPVFGYISAGSVQQQRIFIDRRNLPISYGTDVHDKSCLGTDVTDAGFVAEFKSVGGSDPLRPIAYTYLYNFTYIPLTAEFSIIPPYDVIGYTGVFRVCADCTLRGTNKAPAFWQ